MRQYPKINVTHFFKQSKGDKEQGAIYYYINIKRRTITKVAMIPHMMTKEEFLSGFYDDAINISRMMITKVCELYLEDLEDGNVKYNLKDLADRDFKSKDDFINGLNSYICYYYEYDFREVIIDIINKVTKKAIYSRLENIIDFSMMDNRDKTRLYDTLRSMGNKKRLLFYYKNLQNEDLANFCLFFNLHCYLWGDNHRDHISIMEYIIRFRNELPKLLLKSQISGGDTDIINDYEKTLNKLEVNEDYIRTKFLPIIDKAITPEYQLSRYN